MEQDTKYLLSLYEGLAFPEHYGRKELAGICAVAASYGRTVMPKDIIAKDAETPRTLSLWMLIGWAIDNVFDKRRAETTDADVAALVKILDLDPAEVPAAAAPNAAESGPAPSPLVASLLEASGVLYKEYLARMQPYMDANPEASAMQRRWFSRYIATVREDKAFDRVADFEAFRVPACGIMCANAHMLLFLGAAPVPSDEPLWCKTALALGHYNDLVSLPRDMAQGTPNVVTARMREVGADVWDALKWADEATHELEVQLLHECARDASAPFVRDIAEFSIYASRDWHMEHPRYADGAALLVARRAGDRAAFEAILARQGAAAAGDPRGKA